MKPFAEYGPIVSSWWNKHARVSASPHLAAAVAKSPASPQPGAPKLPVPNPSPSLPIPLPQITSFAAGTDIRGLLLGALQ